MNAAQVHKHTHAKGSGSLRLRGGIYQARWMVNGKVYCRSTKTGNKREAEERLREFTDAYRTRDEKRIVENLTARTQGLNAKIEQLERERTAMRLPAAWTAYVEAQNRPDSGKVTLEGYESQYGRLVDWLKKNRPEIAYVQQIDQAVADAFMAHVASSFSANTFNKYRTFLRCMWRTLAKSARMEYNPWEAIRRKTGVSHSRRELTIDELKRVCESLDGEMRLLFAIGLYTGLRLGDCATLGWGNVDLDRGFISTIPRKTARHAHGKPVTIPIHAVLAQMLAETPVGQWRGFVVPEIAEVYGRDEALLSQRIKRIFERNGIRTQAVKKSAKERAKVDVGFHSLRHSYISLCANAGVPLALVQSIVGHTNPAMTLHYFHESATALKTAVAALPDVTKADSSPKCENAPTSVLERFYAIVSEMDGGERARAAEYLNGLVTAKGETANQ